MKNLNDYYNQIKTENLPNEKDFAMILSKVNTRTEVRNNFYNNNYSQKTKSPLFAWSFGFAGFAVAAFMFFINPNNSTEDANLAMNNAVVAKSTNPTVVQKREKVSNAINLIDSMDSFESVVAENN
jgi:hypothetical protein